MNKKDIRQRLIRQLIQDFQIHTQQELQEHLKAHGIKVTQTTLSRDIKELRLIKVSDQDSHYEISQTSQNNWEDRLRLYIEDALIMMRPVQHQVVLKVLPGLAQSFGAILDAMKFPDIVATLCGDDTCLLICEDQDAAQRCFEQLSTYTPPYFFTEGYQPGLAMQEEREK